MDQLGASKGHGSHRSGAVPRGNRRGIRNETEGTAVLFSLVLAVGLGIVNQRAKRRPVEVRPDIREWLNDTASLTGETVEEPANTALSAYRAELGGIQRDEYSA